MSANPSPSGKAPAAGAKARKPWKILVVDDDTLTQTYSKAILQSITFAGRGVEILNALTGQQAREILKQHPDVAVALVDVVMETPRAGLELVETIRKELANSHMRVIIRTGHHDDSPEREIIDHYDIDDYKHKDELSPKNLYITIRSALKAYRDIITIERNRRSLENILSATTGLNLAHTGEVLGFCSDMLMQVATLCNEEHDRPREDTRGFIYTFDGAGGTILARLGRYAGDNGDPDEECIRTCTQWIVQNTAQESMHAGTVLLRLGSNLREPVGFIHLEHTDPLSNHDQHLIHILVNRTTLALENLRLHEHLKHANRESLYMLALAAEFKDRDTGEHIHRIARQTRMLAMELGIPANEAQEMGQASMLHDIGKLGVPDTILQKEGPLTEEEFEIIRRHPQTGARILENHPWFQQAKEIALGHHERWDGKGYPCGIRGPETPLAARIVAVVDVFDALFHKRPYKEAWAIEDCRKALVDGAGSQFDPEVVDAFVRILDREGSSFLDAGNEEALLEPAVFT